MKRNEQMIAMATFIGATANAGGEYDMFGYIPIIKDEVGEQHLFFGKEMRFDESWDWLMQVVAELKLDGIDPDRGEEALDRLDNCLMEVDFEAVYKQALDMVQTKKVEA